MKSENKNLICFIPLLLKLVWYDENHNMTRANLVLATVLFLVNNVVFSDGEFNLGRSAGSKHVLFVSCGSLIYASGAHSGRKCTHRYCLKL